MAYGDYNGPDKADKGLEGGSCMRTRCQAPNAIWYSHATFAWYCRDCCRDIQFDSSNLRVWKLKFESGQKHPMFETRTQMKARNAY